MGFRSLVVWKHRLFVTATPGPHRRRRAVRDHGDRGPTIPGLVQVSPREPRRLRSRDLPRRPVPRLRQRARRATRCGRTSGHGQPFKPVVTGGAGRGDADHLGRLDAGLPRRAVRRRQRLVQQGTLPLSELIRIQRDGEWTLVVGKPAHAARTARCAVPDQRPGRRLRQPLQRPLLAHGGAGRRPVRRHQQLERTSLKAIQGRRLARRPARRRSGLSAVGHVRRRRLLPGDPQRLRDQRIQLRRADAACRTAPTAKNLYIGSANHAQGTMIIDDRDAGLLVADQPARARSRRRAR